MIRALILIAFALSLASCIYLDAAVIKYELGHKR